MKVFLGGTCERSSESKQMAHSLKAVENMLKANGVIVFSGEKALLEVADYLNKSSFNIRRMITNGRICKTKESHRFR